MMRAQYCGDVLNNRVANELTKRGFMISPAGVRRCHAAPAERAGDILQNSRHSMHVLVFCAAAKLLSNLFESRDHDLAHDQRGPHYRLHRPQRLAACKTGLDPYQSERKGFGYRKL